MVLNGVEDIIVGVDACVRTTTAVPLGDGKSCAVKQVSPACSSNCISYLGYMRAVCIIPMDVPRYANWAGFNKLAMY